MPNFYIETTTKLGTEGKYILENVKNYKQTTIYKHLVSSGKKFTVYSYTNFYDENTFKIVEKANI